MISNIDPKNIYGRLYDQCDRLLTDMEANPLLSYDDRKSGVIALGRIMIMFVGLRKENADDSNRGSAVRRYEGVFKASAGAGARGKRAGPRPRVVATAATPDDDDDAA